MSGDPRNRAAYLKAPKAYPFAVEDAPFTPPGHGEVVIRVRAAAINPVDWAIQVVGTKFLFPWLAYPAVMGQDVAGVVTRVGGGVTRFRAGERVLAHAVGADSRRNRPSEGGFQLYVVVPETLVAPIPDAMPFETAVVVPLGASTAACGLYMGDYLGLEYPVPRAVREEQEAKSGAKKQQKKKRTVLIWGGSTSVGCNAIQLAVASGYNVFTTCSPRNFALVKRLGATQAFDYSSATVVHDILHAFDGEVCAGAFSIGATGADGCFAVLSKLNGHHHNKFISLATYPIATNKKPSLGTIVYYGYWQVSWWIKCRAHGIRSKFIFGSDLVANDVGPALYKAFLPRALADGSFVPAPEPQVVGEGLEKIQEACEIQQKGVSAKKIVVRL